jgi:hypothetical protein
MIPTHLALTKLLDTLNSIRSCAERAPYPPKNLVAMHGERAHMVSSFAMIRMMAEHAIETIKSCDASPTTT